MESKTLQQIENINQCLKWVKDYKPEDYPQRFLQLVNNRKILRRIAEAEVNNPGIAAFGKSQVGKSYLISCLLQDNGKPFLVYSGDKAYDFVFQINPPSEEGGGKESTGVVSRFSSFKRRPDDYNRDLPVLVKSFSMTDIILIIADMYFNNLNYKSLKESEIEDLTERFCAVYKSKPSFEYPVITADDVLFMKDYFKKSINNAQSFTNAAFFDKLALVIENVPKNEYINIFSNLWNNDSNINRLYNKLYGILNKFNFPRYLYLPIDSVVHQGVRENTIMSVQCLKQFLNAESEFLTDVYVKNGTKYEKCATQIPKSEICAICAEIVFKIEDSFLQSSGRYDLSGIGDDVKNKLTSDEIQMTMLENNDLLDFPGAKSMEQEKLEGIKDSTLMNCFLRGKVAYLFNKYNEEMSINILLYCHHNKDNDVTYLYKLLNEWVNNYVGKTPEERRKKIQTTEVPPLFYIGTMFNLDMLRGIGSDVSEVAINQRWTGRLETVVNHQCFHTYTVDWVKNFTTPGASFKNSYMLRDFKFSGPKAGLYDGFVDLKGNIIGEKETSMIMSKDYYDMMRNTFIKNQYCKQFFKNPALSFDVAASINNDGALYILENLATVAKNIGLARQNDFDNTLKAVADRVTDIMDDYYVSDDTSVILDQNIQKADEIFTEMDFTCQKNPEYFGHLLARLQISEPECFKFLHSLIPQLPSMVNNPSSDYELIRKRCKNFEGCKTELDKWNYLLKVYHFENQEKAEEFLSKNGVDHAKLFKGEFIKRTNSAVISDEIFNRWKKRFDEPVFKNSMSGAGKMDDEKLNKLTQCLVSAAIFLNLVQRIEKEISPFTDILDTNSMNEYLVADVISSLISSFVMDFGYSYLSDEQVANVKSIAAKRSLPCYNYMEKERQETYDEEQTTTLFNDIFSLSDCFTPAYEANYNSWLEYMYVAFVANISVPDYDEQANGELKTLLDQISK
ncbi:MAG: putative virulence factor [Bacteroidales bacterium]|nr:putative virulence factor [Bacteroidales bacterium]